MKHNIIDIKGLKVGQAQNTEAKTGVTVVIAEKVLSAAWMSAVPLPAQEKQIC